MNRILQGDNLPILQTLPPNPPTSSTSTRHENNSELLWTLTNFVILSVAKDPCISLLLDFGTGSTNHKLLSRNAGGLLIFPWSV